MVTERIRCLVSLPVSLRPMMTENQKSVHPRFRAQSSGAISGGRCGPEEGRSGSVCTDGEVKMEPPCAQPTGFSSFLLLEILVALKNKSSHEQSVW